jgi:filamin
MKHQNFKIILICIVGLFPHWKTLNPHQSVSNCERAMDIAHRQFGVPKVLEPEYLASPWLDELSGMTYLSYFMKPDGPGYNASMRWVNSQIRHPVSNFTVIHFDSLIKKNITKF